MNNRNVFVTNGKWSVSYTSGYGIQGVILNVYQFPLGMHKSKPMRKGDGYGKQFANTEAAQAWAFEHGYLKRYFKKAVSQ